MSAENTEQGDEVKVVYKLTEKTRGADCNSCCFVCGIGSCIAPVNCLDTSGYCVGSWEVMT